MNAKQCPSGLWKVTLQTRDGRVAVGLGRTFMAAMNMAKAIADSRNVSTLDAWRGRKVSEMTEAA